MLVMFVSSASLPPCQPRSGTHRALRGQSSAAAHLAAPQQQQQPPWAFIGAGSTANHSHPALATWQPAATTANHNTATVVNAGAGGGANLPWRPPSHLDQTVAAAVSSPLTMSVVSSP